MVAWAPTVSHGLSRSQMGFPPRFNIPAEAVWSPFMTIFDFIRMVRHFIQSDGFQFFGNR